MIKGFRGMIVRPKASWFIVLTALWGALSSALPRMSNGRELGVTIMGCIAQHNSRQSVALIKEQSGTVRAVKIGFKVADYKVVEITTKYMTLERGTERIIVYQDKFAREFINAKYEPTPEPTSSTVFAFQNEYNEDGFSRKSGQIQMSPSYRNKIVTQDMARILMQATAEPYMQNGQIAGFLLSQIDPGSIYDKAGFRDGDVVQVINGRRLNSVAGAVAFLRSLKDEENVDVELMRGGAITRLKVSVK
jgi:type II secretion system protein C